MACHDRLKMGPNNTTVKNHCYNSYTAWPRGSIVLAVQALVQQYNNNQVIPSMDFFLYDGNGHHRVQWDVMEKVLY